MQTQLFRDRFGVITYDDVTTVLKLCWLADTEHMTDDDYMQWLERYAASAEQYRVPFLLIDTRAFRHHPGEQTWLWREEHIIPSYTSAGVKKFAFLVAMAAAPKIEPAPEGSAKFPTGYYTSREQIDRWFTL